MRKMVLILTVIFLTVSGCGYSDTEKIEQTVRDYNAKLPQVLKSSPDILKEVATDKEQGRMQIFIARIADGNSVLDAKLLQFTVNDVTVRPLDDKETKEYRVFPVRQKDDESNSPYTRYDLVEGRLEAEEVWDYSYLDLKTGKTKSQKQKIRYKTTYILARNNGKWYVADINFKEEILKTEEAK